MLKYDNSEDTKKQFEITPLCIKLIKNGKGVDEQITNNNGNDNWMKEWLTLISDWERTICIKLQENEIMRKDVREQERK